MSQGPSFLWTTKQFIEERAYDLPSIKDSHAIDMENSEVWQLPGFWLLVLSHFFLQ